MKELTTESKPKQEIYKIRNIKDFLRTDMTDINIIFAILSWIESEKDVEKFYKIYTDEYNGDVFLPSKSIIYSTMRDFMRLNSEEDVIKLCKWIEKLSSYDNQYLDNIYLSHLIRFSMKTIEKYTITSEEVRDIFYPMKYTIYEKKDKVYVVRSSTKETHLILDKDENGNVIIYKDLF